MIHYVKTKQKKNNLVDASSKIQHVRPVKRLLTVKSFQDKNTKLSCIRALNLNYRFGVSLLKNSEQKLLPRPKFFTIM